MSNHRKLAFGELSGKLLLLIKNLHTQEKSNPSKSYRSEWESWGQDTSPNMQLKE